MWFILSCITIVFWGATDLFCKIGSPNEDRISHWKMVMAVGTVMGIHATVELLMGAEFRVMDFIYYLPATFFYILSMILGYVGLRYIMLSVSSPVCNSSGAVACILCLVFLRQMPDVLSWIGIVLVCVGVFCLALLEKRGEKLPAQPKKYTSSFIAICFPIFYCILDGLGTFADALLLDSGFVNEESANIAYEYTFLGMAVFAFIYVVLIKKEKLHFRSERPRFLGALCETAGQFAYIYAIGDNPVVAAPMISTYCVFSVLLSRIFLKEKLTRLQYFVICIVFLGIIMMGVSEGLSE